MTTNQPQRYGGLLGVAGGVLGLIGTFTMATLEFMPGADDAVASFTDDTSRILGGAQMLVISAVLIAAFGAVVHRRIRAAAPDSALSTVAASGYMLAALAGAMATIGYVGGAMRVDLNDTITESQATTMADISMLTIGSIVPVALALAVGATSIAALRFQAVLPRWLGWVGVPIATGMVILPINYAVLPIGVLWTIVAGVVLSSTGAQVIDVSTQRVETPAGV